MLKSITIPTEKDNKPKYPYIGVHKGVNGTTYVLFNSENRGFIISTDRPTKRVGDYQTDWIESNFTPTDDTISLSNN